MSRFFVQAENSKIRNPSPASGTGTVTAPFVRYPFNGKEQS